MFGLNRSWFFSMLSVGAPDSLRPFFGTRCYDGFKSSPQRASFASVACCAPRLVDIPV